MADISKIKLPNGNEYYLKDKKLLSRGEQLVVNGNGMLGDNTNFDRLVFDGSYSNNSPGSFTYLTPNEYINFTTQDLFPINPDKCYEIEIDMITKNHLAYMYTFLSFFDVDKFPIAVHNHGYYTGSDAVLTSSCDNNSTQITVDDASFYANLIGTKVTISFWDYKNSFGYKYPPHTYTRYITNDVTIANVSGNTITFSTKIGGSGVTHAVGTTISRVKYGGTYKYVAANGVYPDNTSWSHYRGFMEGVDFSGQNVNGKFPPGVAYAKFGFLWNYTKKDDQVWVTNISVREYRDAYTVNGHTVNADVPSDAKFTDTTYESKTATQNGTDLSLVTTGEKYNWNSKTSNTGTVTKVIAGTGLSIGTTAGGNFTTSGTINHTNAVTAQNTQAIYPIKIDAQGHISAYGSAVTPLTASSTLDATKLEGTVPTACLPSYVDDVLQYDKKADFPATGETGKIYVDKATNLTWRWGGSAYVEISPSLALGTTSSTAFRGDYGNSAYAHAVTNKGSAFSSGLYKITTNSEGHVTAATAVQKSDITGLGIPGTDNDTKNTAGSTNSSKKLFLIGAETQAANPQTYSQDTAYVGTDGKLYSNSKVVLTGGSNAASSVTITPSTTDIYSMTSAGSVTAGTKNVPTKIDTSKFSGGSFTRGTFNQGTLPTLTFAMDTTDTKKLKISFSQGTLPTHAADTFTAAALQSGFYTAGTANTPTAVTLPGRSSSAIKAWTGYTAATAAAQTFTGSSS